MQNIENQGVVMNKSYTNYINKLIAKQGIHSITIKDTHIAVESNFGKMSFVSKFELNQYSKALEVFNKLIKKPEFIEINKNVKE